MSNAEGGMRNAEGGKGAARKPGSWKAEKLGASRKLSSEEGGSVRDGKQPIQPSGLPASKLSGRQDDCELTRLRIADCGLRIEKKGPGRAISYQSASN